MLSAQEKRDELFVAILKRMHQDEKTNEFAYSFNDITPGEGYFGVQYLIHKPDDKPILVGFGQMVTDSEMSHVLILTFHPMQGYSIFFPLLATE